MSIKVMSWVWDEGPREPTERFLLLALADIADDAGKCWPAVGTVAARCCMSERNARRIIRKLEDGGWLETQAQAGRNHTNVYHIRKPDNLSARTICPPGQMKHENRTNEALKPDTAMSAEPSRTIKEPSIDREAAKTPAEIIFDAVALFDPAFDAAVTSFIAYRRKSKAGALTATAAKRLGNSLRQILDQGGDLSEALGMAEERGWRTIKPEWYFKEVNGNDRPSHQDTMLRASENAARAFASGLFGGR